LYHVNPVTSIVAAKHNKPICTVVIWDKVLCAIRILNSGMYGQQTS